MHNKCQRISIRPDARCSILSPHHLGDWGFSAPRPTSPPLQGNMAKVRKLYNPGDDISQHKVAMKHRVHGVTSSARSASCCSFIWSRRATP